MCTIEVTEADRDYIGAAKAKGMRLHRDGAVEVIGEALVLVRDGGMTYGADATGCGCSTEEKRAGHACEHMWAGRYASEQAASEAETAA